MFDAGLIVICAFISPFQRDRDFARSLYSDGEFIEVFVNTPMDVIIKRDPKGHYKKAQKGLIENFMGIDSSYEIPENSEITINDNLFDAISAVELIKTRL